MGNQGMGVRCHMRSATFHGVTVAQVIAVTEGLIQVLRFSLSVAATEGDYQVSDLLVAPVVVYREAGRGQVI